MGPRFSKVEIGRRSRPDPDGDAVDIFPADAELTHWWLEQDESLSELGRQLAESLAGLGKAYARHLQCDVPFWLGVMVARDGRELKALMMPCAVPDRVATYIGQVMSGLGRIGGQSYLHEFKAEPFGRYDHGSIVLYKRNDDEHDQERIHGLESLAGVAWRSAITSSGEEQGGLQPPEQQPWPKHGVSDWVDRRKRLIGALKRLEHPVQEARLIELIERVGGIAVLPINGGRFLRMGCIRLCELDADEAAQVCILINDALPTGMRTVVLMHELSHYILHFPLLLQAQWVDELSHRAPELELLFASTAHRHIRGGIASIEHQANLLACCFLVEMTARAKLALFDELGILTEFDTSNEAELNMQFLKPYFPELDDKDEWNRPLAMQRLQSKGETLAESAFDLNHARPQSLMSAISAALFERDELSVVNIDELSDQLIPALDAFNGVLDKMVEAVRDVPGPQWAGEARKVLGALIDDASVADAAAWSPSLAHSGAFAGADAAGAGVAGELGSLASGADRVLIAPAGWTQAHMLFTRRRLRPAADNPDGALDGRWLACDIPGEPPLEAGTIDRFKKACAADEGLALYRFTYWESLQRAHGMEGKQ